MTQDRLQFNGFEIERTGDREFAAVGLRAEYCIAISNEGCELRPASGDALHFGGPTEFDALRNLITWLRVIGS